MNCQEAQDLLLEADLPALLDETTDLGRHVSACPECGALARRILDAEAALDRALALRPERPRSRGWPPLATWGALAAAALVVLVLMPRQRPPVGPALSVEQTEPGDVDVDVTSNTGKTAVVFRTADPTITVIWYFQD